MCADQTLWFLQNRNVSDSSPHVRHKHTDTHGQSEGRGKAIGDYCVQSPSVAEIAARLSLPIGATRFLVDDLVTQGYLRVYAPLGDSMTIDERCELITRTLRGLRAL